MNTVTEKTLIKVPLKKGSAEIDIDSGFIRYRNSRDEVFFEYKLRPSLECSDNSDSPAELSLADSSTDSKLILKGEGTLAAYEITIDIGEEKLDYQVTCSPLEGSPSVEYIHYGNDGCFVDKASVHNFEEFFIICPDRYSSAIPNTGKVAVKLGVPSFRFDNDNNFPHEGGRTIVAPYITAFKTGQDWFGIGTLEIPASQYGLNIHMEEGKASIDFEYGGSLTLDSSYSFPKITMYTGEDKLSTCKAYIDRLYDEGLAVPNDQWHENWQGPIYCFFSDQMYEYQTDRDTVDMLGEMTMTENYCNEKFLADCTDFLDEKDIPYGVIIMDYGWFVCNGQWKEHTERFKDLKGTIKKLQDKGKKVLLWYSPYFIAEQADHYKNHPEVAVQTKDGKPFFVTRFAIEKNYQSDFTHPTMRELCRQDLEYLLSPEYLNADGIKVDCTHQPPLIENVFHDPSWGTGELFHYKASKFIYDEAKKIKPDCLINATAGNPLFNGTYDLHRIHDAMEYNLDAYEERAWAANFCRSGISDLDDWPSYDIYTVRANLRKIAYGVPSLYALKKRGVWRKNRCSYGYARTTKEIELKQLSAIYKLYQLAPVTADQEINIDPFKKIFERRYTSGPLTGFYSALTLSGNQAVAVYTPEKACFLSISNNVLALPLPPGAKVTDLNLVKEDGSREDVGPYEILDDKLLFETEICSGGYYQLDYSLQGE